MGGSRVNYLLNQLPSCPVNQLLQQSCYRIWGPGTDTTARQERDPGHPFGEEGRDRV